MSDSDSDDEEVSRDIEEEKRMEGETVANSDEREVDEEDMEVL
jgi:hypothetical protein